MEPTRVIKGSYRDAVRRARALERLGKGVELTQESQRLGGSR
ncbi:MAG: hypothetical protein RQ885_08165 [Desulfurococcales archaeon]|jgi:hypothetical protein|nr:hypothetical protein [Desulfurococcales archaeon]